MLSNFCKNVSTASFINGIIWNKKDTEACLFQGSFSFELFKFHKFSWLFLQPFQVFLGMTLGFTVIWENLQKFFFCFKVFFDLKRFNRNKLRCSPKREQFALLNYYSLSYIVLALSSAVTNLSKITLIFHATFKDWQLLNSMTFQAWKMNLLNFTTFQVFHDLYEPYYSFAYFSLVWWIIYLKLKINLKKKNGDKFGWSR